MTQVTSNPATTDRDSSTAAYDPSVRLPAIDCLRGLAIVGIALLHA